MPRRSAIIAQSCSALKNGNVSNLRRHIKSAHSTVNIDEDNAIHDKVEEVDNSGTLNLNLNNRNEPSTSQVTSQTVPQVTSQSSQIRNIRYKGIFKKRTREKNDGCAIYFRENKFNLKEHSFVEYFQPNVNLLNRDNIGIVVRLALRNLPDKTIVVATTHLLYNPKRHDIKLAQMQILLAEIDRIAYKSTDESGKAIYFPIILTGDFNLKPYTIVHDLIMNGFVKKSWNCYCQAPHKYSSMTHLPYTKLLPFRLGITDSCQHYNVIQNRNSIQREISDFKFVKLYNSERKSQSTMYNNHDWRRLCLDYNKFDSCWLHHDLNFGSVYSYDKDGINDVTTFQSEWCTVDYIFYGPLKKVDELKIDGDLKLLSYLKLPNVSQANILRVIPNEVCSSDHLPLLATFHLPIDV
ncbi:hypothetical protein PGB90_008568 [Kerria lacca]